MLKHSPFSRTSSRSANAKLAAALDEPAVVEFKDKTFIDQTTEIAGLGLDFPEQDNRWEVMWHQAAGNGIIQDQISSNGKFILWYGRDKNGISSPYRTAESDLAWQAYLFWLSYPEYTGTLAEYQADPLAQYSYVTYGGWDGSEADFKGYGGWWFYERRKTYFNSINLQNI